MEIDVSIKLFFMYYTIVTKLYKADLYGINILLQICSGADYNTNYGTILWFTIGGGNHEERNLREFYHIYIY